MTQARKPHVLIVGGGIGGLFLAQFLRKNGAATFAVYERDASPSARPGGWAIGLSLSEDYAKLLPDDVPPLRSACHLLPLDLPSQAVFFPARIGTEDTPETPCVRANRRKLRELLSTDVPIHWGKQAVGLEEAVDGQTVTVTFQDGTSATGDILVAADGTWSRIRECVMKQSNADVLQPLPVSMIHGYTTLRGAALERHLSLAHSVILAPQPRALFFCGLDTVAPAGDAASFYWFVFYGDADAAAPDHWLRTTTTAAAVGPDAQKRKYAHALERTAALDPALTAIIRQGGPAAIDDAFTLYHDAIITELPHRPPRVLLIGDAAHPTTPFRGEGAVVAIQDALRLSQLLADTDTDTTDAPAFLAALDALQTDVLARGSAVVQLSRDAALALGAKSQPAEQQPPQPPQPPQPQQPAKPRALPWSWGYQVRPIPERTVSLGLGGAASSS